MDLPDDTEELDGLSGLLNVIHSMELRDGEQLVFGRRSKGVKNGIEVRSQSADRQVDEDGKEKD